MSIPPSPTDPTDPGIILIFAKSSAKASSLPQDLVSRLSSPLRGISSSVQYKAADKGNEKQHLLLCQMPDPTHLNSEELGKILTEGDVGIEWDVRIFREVEVCGPAHEDDKDEAAPTLLTALVQPPPGGEADLDAWYRSEHNQQMSEQPGWKRTCRYSLLSHFQIPPGSPIEIISGSDNEEQSAALRFLAIHEFGKGEQLGDTVGAVEPVSEWTRRILREAVGMEAGIWRRVDQERT